MDSKYLEQNNLHDRMELRNHAVIGAAVHLKMGTPFFDHLAAGKVAKEPLEIYDLNGHLLFLDYPVNSKEEHLGTIRTAATKIIGNPVVSYEIGKRYWDYESAAKKLTARVKKEYPKLKVIGTRLICYSYPKLGVIFELADSAGKTKRLIYDVASLEIISEKESKPDHEGAIPWSFYDSLDEEARKVGLRQFDIHKKLIAEGRPEDIRAIQALKPISEINAFFPIPLLESKRLQYCPHYRETEPRSHHCFVLHCQQKNDYCAVATCQMILCYYRYYYSQDEIAPKLGYNPGGCPSDQSGGYKTLTCNHLNAAFDTNPTWEKAKAEIDALHPFKSGISGHARACAGYSRLKIKKFGIDTKSLFIYDPWPWNADYKIGGAVSWENWNDKTHTNYVTTKIACP
jgi:hypothetical protein